MLNERLELEAYVSNPKSENPRLQPKVLTNKFDIKMGKYSLRGITRVLTIVTQEILFPEGMDSADSDLLQIRMQTVPVILNHWCGFLPEGDFQEVKDEAIKTAVEKWFTKYPESDGWLYEYWKHQYITYQMAVAERKKKRQNSKSDSATMDISADDISKKGEVLWKGLVNQWKDQFNSTNNYMAESVNFNNIIADALAAGPLKEQYLVFRKDLYDSKKTKFNIKKIQDLKTQMNMFGYLYKCEGNASTKLKFLKNVAAFLLWKQEHPDSQNEVLLQKERLLGWYGLDDCTGTVKTWFLEKFTWLDHPVMTRIAYPDFAKFGFDPEYLKYFDFQLIKPEDEEKYAEDYWILKDSGHGQKTPFIIKNI